VSADENKRLMQAAFEGLARGDTGPYAAIMAEDITWKIMGRSAWSRTFTGRESCARDLFQPLYARFTERQVMEALSFTAEGDLVVVEARARPLTTTSGRIYENEYCYVCRFEDGMLKSVHDYMDNAHLLEAVGPPPWAQAEAGA